MKAEARPFRVVTNIQNLVIPFFQRAYVWKKDNWAALLGSLTETNKSNFLGSVILKQEPILAGNLQRVRVIDGQQRLTTLSILLKALCDLMPLTDRDAYKLAIVDLLFYRETIKVLHPKITHSVLDAKAYTDVLMEDSLIHNLHSITCTP